MVLECQVSFGRTAPGQDRRISGVEKLLHLLFLIRSGVDVAVTVDEPRHCTHALCIDGLRTGSVGATGRNRGDPAAPDNDRPLIDHVTVTNDDPRVGDHKVLGRETLDTTEAPGKNKERKDKYSFHSFNSPEEEDFRFWYEGPRAPYCELSLKFRCADYLPIVSQ